MLIILLIVDILDGAFVGSDSCKGAERVGWLYLQSQSHQETRPLASWPGLGARGKSGLTRRRGFLNIFFSCHFLGWDGMGWWRAQAGVSGSMRIWEKDLGCITGF